MSKATAKKIAALELKLMLAKARKDAYFNDAEIFYAACDSIREIELEIASLNRSNSRRYHSAATAALIAENID